MITPKLDIAASGMSAVIAEHTKRTSRLASARGAVEKAASQLRDAEREMLEIETEVARQKKAMLEALNANV